MTPVLGARRVLTGFVLCTALTAPAVAMDLGARASWPSPATTLDAAALASLGLRFVVVAPSPEEAADLSAALQAPEATAAIHTLLDQAEAAGLGVYLGGLEVARADHALPPHEQSRPVHEALSAILAEFGRHSALAGFVWRAPAPVPIRDDASAPQVEQAAHEWAVGTADLARSCAALCAEGRRTFVVETDRALPLTAALPGPVPGLAVWRSQRAPRGPGLGVQQALLEAALWGEAGGLDLSWEVFGPSQCARWATLAVVAGCGAVVLGSSTEITSEAALFRPHWVRELAEFARPLEPDAVSATRGSDVTIAIDPFPELCRAIHPTGDDGQDQILPALAALNQAGRSVRLSIRPPEGGPVVAPAAGGREAPKTPVLLPLNAARMEDAYLAGVLAAADRGWTVAVLADIATLSLGGGARAKESRDLATAALPIERTRPFRERVTELSIRETLGPKPLRRGDKVAVAPLEAQCIWRGTARPGATVLAEWSQAAVPAYVTARRGGGSIVLLNGLPGLESAAVLGGVLDTVNAPDSRLVAAEPDRGGGDRPTEPRQGTLDRYGLIPEDPYRADPEIALTPPPEFTAGLGAPADASAYAIHLSGDRGRAVLLGHQPLGAERRRYLFEGQTAPLGGWDLIARRGARTACSTAGLRLPEGDGPCRFEPSDGTTRPLVYSPRPGWREAPEPGVFVLEPASPEHRLTDPGGARVVRCERVPAPSGAPEAANRPAYLAAEVDRPAVLTFALSEERMTGKMLRVGLGTPESPAAGLTPQWWVTWDGTLYVDALGRVPIFVVDDLPLTEDPQRCHATLAPGTDGQAGPCDGVEAVLLECYANAEATLAFEHWTPPGKRAVLALRGVRGGLYGDPNTTPDSPARVVVLLNGRVVYDSDTPWRTLVANDTPEEWSDLTIPLPVEALHRGANRVTVRNAGPGAVWISGAEVRFGVEEEAGG